MQGNIDKEMNDLNIVQLFLDIVFVVLMNTVLSRIVGYFEIDVIPSLKVEDRARIGDKMNFCSICGVDRSSVQIYLFSWREADKHLKNIQKSINYGTIYTICIV